MVPAWVIILATVAGMVTSVLMAWAAVKAQVIQPILASIIHEVIESLTPDMKRWDASESIAHESLATARRNTENIVAVKRTVEDTQRAVHEFGRRGDERHRKLDESIDRIEKHLSRQDVAAEQRYSQLSDLSED